MVIAGKANGSETMRFIVSTNCAHISFCQIIYNNTKALKGRNNKVPFVFKTPRTLVETMYHIVSAPVYGNHRKGKRY